MGDLIDDIQPRSSFKKGVKTLKILSIALLSLSVIIVTYTFLIVQQEIKNPPSPWLPTYTAYFIHGALINFAIVQLGGLIPSLILYWRKEYLASSVVMIGFLLIARILENHLEFYRLFAF